MNKLISLGATQRMSLRQEEDDIDNPSDLYHRGHIAMKQRWARQEEAAALVSNEYGRTD